MPHQNWMKSSKQKRLPAQNSLGLNIWYPVPLGFPVRPCPGHLLTRRQGWKSVTGTIFLCDFRL